MFRLAHRSRFPVVFSPRSPLRVNIISFISSTSATVARPRPLLNVSFAKPTGGNNNNNNFAAAVRSRFPQTRARAYSFRFSRFRNTAVTGQPRYDRNVHVRIRFFGVRASNKWTGLFEAEKEIISPPNDGA